MAYVVQISLSLLTLPKLIIVINIIITVNIVEFISTIITEINNNTNSNNICDDDDNNINDDNNQQIFGKYLGGTRKNLITSPSANTHYRNSFHL